MQLRILADMSRLSTKINDLTSGLNDESLSEDDKIFYLDQLTTTLATINFNYFVDLKILEDTDAE